MDFLEKDLEHIIYENLLTSSGRDLLEYKGLELPVCVYGNDCRIPQIPALVLKQPTIGNYGRADLVVVYKDNDSFKEYRRVDVYIYELKKGQLDWGCFHQITSYYKGIETWTRKRNPKIQLRFHLVMIGRSLNTRSSFMYLMDMFGGEMDLSAYSYQYDIDGLSFTREYGYNLVETGF